MLKKIFLLIAIAALVSAMSPPASSTAPVVREGDRVYIADRTGERWDITQAASIGFKPERFQYGLGRNAFTPLDDTLLVENPQNVDSGLRIIGVSKGDDAKAFSVPRLSRHEIANTEVGGKPVAVGY